MCASCRVERAIAERTTRQAEREVLVAPKNAHRLASPATHATESCVIEYLYVILEAGGISLPGPDGIGLDGVASWDAMGG